MATPGESSSSNGNVERRCENADCNVGKLVSMVPKRKTTQFVVEPQVMDKPMLINGFTTIFQVDGTSAKLSDLKNPQTGSATQSKTIYRIVPNTHAHIVNYVVVDADGESLKKINENDPATMRKLLESQKVSADQMLKKLMSGHGSIATTRTTTSGPTSGLSTTRTPAAASTTVKKNTPVAQHSTPIQFPARMHPNLKITAVASGEVAAALNAPTVGIQPLPHIQPVPLANLQNVPTAVMPSNVQSPFAPGVDNADKPIFDKMQAELQELRRTVAMLAEAQAKNQQPQHAPADSDSVNRTLNRS